MISSGALMHRVTIQKQTETSDGHKGFTETWPTLHARVPARVRPLVGRDLERAHQIDPRISHEVSLRYWKNYRTDLVGGRVRLVYHDITDRTFEIVAPPIDADEKHVELTLACREAA